MQIALVTGANGMFGQDLCPIKDSCLTIVQNEAHKYKNYGICHFCSGGQASWYELARKALQLLDIDTNTS